MKHEPQEIEVEVVETIDSVPAHSKDSSSRHESWQKTQNPWQGRIKKIHLRWWPLWSILALVLLIPLLILGILVAACWLMLRGLARLFGGR